MDPKGLFAEIKEEEVSSNKTKMAENLANEDDAFMRFEFLECICRLALQHAKGDDLKVPLMG